MMYDGWVYVAKSDTGHYKIGRSKSPFKRIRHFDTIMPVEVKVVALIPCENYRKAERALQSEFSKYRYKGEWFDIPDEVVGWATNIVCYIDGQFIRRMNGNPIDIDADAQIECNSCCIDYLHDLSDANLVDWPPFPGEKSKGDVFQDGIDIGIELANYAELAY